MLCQICHSAEATVYLVETVNNQHSAMQLCENCAQKRHLGEMLAKPALAIHELLASFLQLGAAPAAENSGLKCPRCAMDFAEFKQRGRFGCADCYDAFRENLLPLFRQFHQSEEHRGRSGPSVTAPGSSPVKLSLRDTLNAAIADENFELAAKLRDQIKRTEGEAETA